MAIETDMDMIWNINKELSLVLSCIKSPIWYEEKCDFENKCLLRELLQKCSGNKIVKMLKEILSAEEKIALVDAELDSFFQNQAKCFAYHMKVKSEKKFPVNKVKMESTEKLEISDSDTPSNSNIETCNRNYTENSLHLKKVGKI